MGIVCRKLLEQGRTVGTLLLTHIAGLCTLSGFLEVGKSAISARLCLFFISSEFTAPIYIERESGACLRLIRSKLVCHINWYFYALLCSFIIIGEDKMVSESN